MRKFNKINAFLLAVVMLTSMLLLSACDGGNADATYQVKVLDAKGEPCNSGVIVKFMQSGSQVAMQPVNKDGVAEKSLPKGDYTVELVFTDSDISSYYDESTAVLSADKSSIEIVLMNGVGKESVDLVATSPVTGENKSYTAYYINSGSTYISVEAEDRNYFLFVPTESGTFKFSVDNKDMTIGYYGAPHFVQAASVVDVVDNAFTISVSESNIGTEGGGTAVYVIGVDGVSNASNCVFTIERLGDAEHTISDEPWTEYKTTHDIKPFSLTLSDGEQLEYVDIKGDTDDYKLVYNESDKLYHLNSADGPIIYVHLGKGAPYVSLQTVIMGDGPAGGAPIRAYFFDENDEFIKKEDYTSILSDYFENMDQKLYVYPLNDDLIYIIKNGCNGWWDASSPDYIFEDCNPELGWMFACCYVD